MERYYKCSHEVTENYIEGLRAMRENRLLDALEILSREPYNSPCYSLARGNKALVLRRLDHFQEAEEEALSILSHMDTHGCPHPPSWVQFARTYAEALAGQGKCKEAIQAFRSTAEISDRLTEQFPDHKVAIELEKAHSMNTWGATQISLRDPQAAIGIIKTALEIYKRYEEDNKIGIAETLTNYAHALRIVGNSKSAELALEEALPLAEGIGDKNQVRKIQLALIQLNSNLIKPDDAYTILQKSADEAESAGFYSTAYVRKCIQIDYIESQGDLPQARHILHDAKRLEPYIDENDLNPAKLRIVEWRINDQLGETEERCNRILIEGANLWYTRISKPLISGDVAAIAEEMHENFRLLARSFLYLNKPEEAVVSFEAGRALAHASVVDGRYLDRVVRANPFASGSVSKELLTSVQDSLADDEVLIVFTVLPPNLVSFVVSNTQVQSIAVPMPDELGLREILFRDIDAIPTRLQEKVGSRAIPSLIQKLAIEVRKAAGERTVCGLFPYSSLHSVPWRAVLRAVGFEWKKLQCSIEFGLFLRTRLSGGTGTVDMLEKCVALGNGIAGQGSKAIDLCDEAREFARMFKAKGSFIQNCTSSEVIAALNSTGVILISCHGMVYKRQERMLLYLDLANGSYAADDLIPERMCADLVILSACESGVYGMTWADFPIGAAPALLRAGTYFCIGTRFRVGARFSSLFFQEFSCRLSSGELIVKAFAEANEELEKNGANLWRDLACVELLGGS